MSRRRPGGGRDPVGLPRYPDGPGRSPFDAHVATRIPDLTRAGASRTLAKATGEDQKIAEPDGPVTVKVEPCFVARVALAQPDEHRHSRAKNDHATDWSDRRIFAWILPTKIGLLLFPDWKADTDLKDKVSVFDLLVASLVNRLKPKRVAQFHRQGHLFGHRHVRADASRNSQINVPCFFSAGL